MTEPSHTVTSTADLSPAGFGGYRKAVAGIVGLLGTVLAAVQPSLPEGTDWARWVGIGIAVCGAVGVYLVKNDVQPVQVVERPAHRGEGAGLNGSSGGVE